ncbi:hypothetical protein JNUCC31_00095 [Paenibacillus sp. JNUCC31]|uniref:hypothetical protein n=1 Tax=Paenibacillus sp. JNUCC-31 TaxID=2777983 RepID=UPI00177AFE4C|nr:hypothetical protein [Paenibacillus sp. JNUCC-31]QOS79416.1 hypothetical protein JNUCC31_00095 [Paenibacillus sp. JNUCC-31]
MNEKIDGIWNPFAGPYFTQEDMTDKENAVQYIAAFKNGCLAGFKYFQIEGEGAMDILFISIS